jgi:hypothetical protein
VAISTSPDLRADDIAVVLGSYPASSEGYVSFKGYLGPAHDGIHRLYRDDTFLSWLEVKADDIAHRLDVPENDRDPRSVVWIKRRAMVNSCQRAEAHELEDEVWGVDPGGGPNKRKPPY